MGMQCSDSPLVVWNEGYFDGYAVCVFKRDGKKGMRKADWKPFTEMPPIGDLWIWKGRGTFYVPKGTIHLILRWDGGQVALKQFVKDGDMWCPVVPPEPPRKKNASSRVGH